MEGSKHRVEYPNGTTYEVDMDKILRLDARKVEIPVVSKVTGGELMRAMEEGHGIAGRLLASVALEAARIQDAINKRAAVLVLDEIPALLKAKGLATARSPGGGVDQREHALNADDELCKLKEVANQLAAIKALLKIEVDGFVMAFSAVKRVMDSQNGFMSNHNGIGSTDSSSFISRGGGQPAASHLNGGFKQTEMSEEIGLPIGEARW